MLTGYNTDIEHEGVVYHVQTEDKGLDKPFILSLVYEGGEILASKRSPYDDLIQNGFNEADLSERLQRQHKLICAAIHAGRINDLKQMSHREAAAKVSVPDEPPAPLQAEPEQPASLEPEPPSDSGTRISVAPGDVVPDSLELVLLDEQALRSGDSVTLRLQVTKGLDEQKKAIAKARVIARILGSSFRPLKSFATTDNQGMAEIKISIPEFKGGRAAMLVRVETEKDVAELRRVIQPSS